MLLGDSITYLSNKSHKSLESKHMIFSSSGKQRRLNKLFTNGKTLVVPVDDSLIFGPKEGLFYLDKTLQEILSTQPNAILGFKRDLEFVNEHSINTSFIYNLTASTVLNAHTKKVVIASVSDALSAGVDCVAAHINFSSKYENEMLHNFAMIANECDKMGLPLLAIAYPRKENVDGTDYNYEDLKEKDHEAFAEIVAHCARVACELGADIVKTYYTGDAESFKKVIKAACGKPVIIAGGPKVSVEKSLRNAHNAILAGGAGISFGRNVFNADNITAYINALKSVIFDESTAQKAFEIYKNL